MSVQGTSDEIAEAPQGAKRARRRVRKAAFAALGGAVGKAINLGASLIAVPITLGYLGKERYGLWMTIASAAALTGVVDFGIGNSVINGIAKADGSEDRREARRILANGAIGLVGLSALGIAAFVAMYPLLRFREVFKITDVSLETDAARVLAVFVIINLASLPLGIVAKAQIAFQDGFVNACFNTAGSIGGLIGTVIAVHHGASLPVLVAISSGAPALALLANAIYLFGRTKRWLIPRMEDIDGRTAVGLIRAGLGFFAMQVAGIVAGSADSIVIAAVMGPAEVVAFSLGTRLLAIPGTLATMATGPLWPAYAEAIARGDKAWAAATLKTSLKVAAALALGTGVSVLALRNEILRVWIGQNVTIGFSLCLGLVTGMVASVLGNALAMYLNAASVLRVQIFGAIGLALLSPIMKWSLARAFGVEGVAWAGVLAYALTTLVPIAATVRTLTLSERGST